MACLPSPIRISKVEIGLFPKILNDRKPVLEIAPTPQIRVVALLIPEYHICKHLRDT
jgi:hypothetical protein